MLPIHYQADWELAKRMLQEKVEGATSGFRHDSAQTLSETACRYLVSYNDDVELKVFVKLADD